MKRARKDAGRNLWLNEERQRMADGRHASVCPRIKGDPKECSICMTFASRYLNAT